MRRVVWLFALGVVVSVAVSFTFVPSLGASDPCESATGGNPRNKPDPLVSGSVWDVTANKTAIQSASLELHKCVSGSSVSQGTTTTNSSGYYEFTTDQGYDYYVDALNTGPLAGMSPASGTSDPSAVVWVGPDATINFEFED